MFFDRSQNKDSEKPCTNLSTSEESLTHLIDVQLLAARALLGDAEAEAVDALGGAGGGVVEAAGGADALGAAKDLVVENFRFEI